MLIKDLKDSRDRDACIRAEKAPSIRTFSVKFRGRAGFIDKPIPNYDEMANAEFNSGIPYKGWQHFDMHDPEAKPDGFYKEQYAKAD